ncbi:MAG: hypothetical protein V1873_01680, partial [Verrucomicrobiota bacterium]
GDVRAHRTSCLKDWWASANNTQYINAVFTAVDWTNGWRLTSSDTAVRKTVTLAPKAWQFEVQYTLSGTMAGQPLYVRHGFSPHLYDLLLSGQATLGGESHAAGVMTLENTNYETKVYVTIGYGDAGHTTGFNTNAVDDDPSKSVYFNTVNMRNQAQTHQVELVGTNSFSFSLGFRAEPSDWDADGMPNTFEDAEGFDPANPGDGADDGDGDFFINWNEYVAATDAGDSNDYLRVGTANASVTGIVVRFQTELKREYSIRYDNEPLTNADWKLANSNAIVGTGGLYEWLDDGSLTDPDPLQVTSRFYRIEVELTE